MVLVLGQLLEDAVEGGILGSNAVGDGILNRAR